MLFINNKWALDKKLYHPDNQDLFNAICEFIDNIDEQDRPLVHSLLKNYEIINDYNAFIPQLIGAFSRRIDKAKNYYICPIVSELNTTIKSGHHFLYELKSFISARVNNNIIFIDSPFSSKFKALENDVIVFVDDFIGSGTQFLDVYRAVETKFSKKIESEVIAIQMQQEGFDSISQAGIRIHSINVRSKAISSGRAIGDISIKDAMIIYDRIESVLAISNTYRLGFEKSEASHESPHFH